MFLVTAQVASCRKQGVCSGQMRRHSIGCHTGHNSLGGMPLEMAGTEKECELAMDELVRIEFGDLT